MERGDRQTWPTLPILMALELIADDGTDHKTVALHAKEKEAWLISEPVAVPIATPFIVHSTPSET